MRTEPAPVSKSAVSEHPVTDLERRDATADHLDFSGELTPENRHLGLLSPVKSLVKKGVPARKPQSVRFTVVACTLRSTWWSLAAGFSTSAI
jgi:hypothetical protein